MKPLPIFIGYDEREHDAYMVAKASIERRASVPVLISPLYLPHLKHSLNRPIENRGGQLWCPVSDAPMSTEFAISRFCIPFLQREGWALFADCDIVCTADIAELFALADDRYAVMVVKHTQESGPNTKMDGQIQTYYSRKNWSSVVLWNCSHPAHHKLRSMERINRWPGRDLHAFKWLDDSEIGELSPEWNYLVGINSGAAKLWHFTLGGPWFENWPGGEFDDLWLGEKQRTMLNRVGFA